MHYQPDPVVFQGLVKQVLSGQEIRQRIAEVNRAALTDFLQRRAPEIWAAAQKEIIQYNEAQDHADREWEVFDSLRRDKPFLLRLVQDILPTVFAILILSLFTLFFSTVRHFVVKVFTFLASLPSTPWTLGALVSVVLILWLINRRRFAGYSKTLADASKAWNESGGRANDAKEKIEPAVANAIAAYVGQHLDQVSRAPFSLELPDTDPKGLSEVPQEGFEIITESRRYIRSLLEKMNGGSLGVAGPRGCGKTTLLRSFYQEGQVDRNKLAIFVAAPVQYDAREFLLHLFTSLCSQVIAKETQKPVPLIWDEMDDLREISTPSLLNPGVFTSLLLVVSLALLFIGASLTIIQYNAGSASTPPATSTSGGTGATSTPPANSTSGGTGATSTPPANSTSGGTGATSTPPTTSTSGGTGPASPSPATSTSGTGQKTSALGPLSGPGIPYLAWGVAGLIAGIFVRLGTGQPQPKSVLDFFFYPWVIQNRRRKKEQDQERADKRLEEKKKLVESARRALRALRFQQSYSSGWSGALKLPIGIEGGANAAVSFAENQLSLPEVVHQYRAFLKLARDYYDRILIAIDELDKLESDKAAKMFLNSIKAIFGQEGVFYLVSISENAMSNFERRGLPIRDEFDSSFDDAVHMGYLDFTGSCDLLALRADQPPPVPYRAFSYVLSGGLPRDLIRYSRKLYDYRRDKAQEPNSVAATCPAIVRREIKAKIEAIKFNLQRVPDEKKTTEVLDFLSKNSWDRSALEDTITKLHAAQINLESDGAEKNAATKGSGADLLALANIMEEIKAFLCFSLAVIESFESITSEHAYTKLKKDLAFDQLAMARQLMAVNRAAAVEIIAKVVTLPPQPPAPAAGTTKPTVGAPSVPQAMAAAAGGAVTAPASTQNGA